MPNRIAFGSCSHPALPQPLWKIINSRHPAAFVWGGDAVYSDVYAGLNWTAVGLQRVHADTHNSSTSSSSNNSWRLTFPPPSIHVDATPDIIHDWFDKQYSVADYRQFVEGWYDDDGDTQLTRPIIFGTVDDHDYGQNNGDYTYRYKRESNLAFVDFLYSGVPEAECSEKDLHESSKHTESIAIADEPIKKGHTATVRCKSTDPMYQRARDGKGVYGVKLFDFSQTRTGNEPNHNILWGGGYFVPDNVARIDPDITNGAKNDLPTYSTTHSVAIFALDVRSNKTSWPKGKQKYTTSDVHNNNSSINIPAFDFLGKHQWEWFQSALANSHAAVNIIVSGLQIHPERFPNDGNIVEEWSKFPEARQLLYDMILGSGVKNPLLVSGDVHMAQIMRKDCILMDGGSASQRRPLVEITTSGMTHSWGTSFSSQPRNHRFPLKLYTYFVSPVFITICHWICPWNDIIIQSVENAKEMMTVGGRTGKQYYTGLNFAEFEFDFNDEGKEASEDEGGGAVTVRIFGKEENALPNLEMRWTFDQLSGNTEMIGQTAQFPQDFLVIGEHQSSGGEWICAPHRGTWSVWHEYTAFIVVFFTLNTLLFLPHGIIIYCLVLARRKCSQWKRSKQKQKKD